MSKPSRRFRLHEPFQHEKYQLEHATAPLGFLNPTRAHFQLDGAVLPAEAAAPAEAGDSEGSDYIGKKHHKEDDEEIPAKNVRFLWRARDNRKGRHALLVQKPQPGEETQYLTPRRTTHYKEVLKNIKLTFTYFPVWDISWLVAVIFTLGSVVWVINGFFAWLPLVAPSTEFHNEVYIGGGVTAFIGAILFFETGSILLVIEAVNSNHSGCFGWAVEQLREDIHGTSGKPIYRFRASRRHCRHHHQNRRNFVGKPSRTLAEEAQVAAYKSKDGPSWQWWPSWHDLRTHYIHELGFLAGMAQLFGATIFGISGITALPGIINHLHPQHVLNGAYWIPQVIGGSGFIVSSALYMLETQQKWWKPAFHILGWHIGFWNFIGAIGFTLCGALGMAYKNSGAEYQASLSTFWGSWAFLIGSYLQLYESLDTHPVEEVSSQDAFDTVK
ncbi:hypothetical protein PV08_11517 [Exophiala spinifera]|uniref:Integral membrane protein n=1 Tax=Exophiala spinifera TaxID=91928 RepID=A0A0D2AV34_9EURO|nr:uncharacterized protein PV08_11517 [Exophiala spinifera]KIW10553.1 hypothetical protein PV08_11517 [Exophiala spinifera]